MGLGLQGAYGAMGAQQSLDQILQGRMLAQKQAALEQQQMIENAQRERTLGQGDRRIDLDEGELGFKQKAYTEEAPTREAGRLYTMAQTTELQRKPQAEQEARTFTTERDKAEHGYRLGEIGATGSNQIRAAEAAAGRKLREVTVQENGQWVTKLIPEADAMGKSFPVAPGANERMDARKFSKARPVMSAIGELSERINTGKGAIAKIQGAAERAKAQANYNDDVAEYLSVVSGYTPLLARALGHTGVLTEQDVQSVRKLFPTPGDSKSLRDRKIARLESIFTQLEEAGTPQTEQEYDYVNGQLVPRK